MQIAVIQSAINSRWGYCPVEAMPLLRLHLDDEAAYESADDAIAAARRNPTMPKGVTFKTFPLKGQS